MDSQLLQQKWPVIPVSNLDGVLHHYVDVLGFIRVEHSETDGKIWEVLLSLGAFHLILREELDGNEKRIGSAQSMESLQEEAKVLYVPVSDPAAYGREVLQRGGRPITGLCYGTGILDHNCEGFYYRAPEGHVLCFWSDWHGPYQCENWEWNDEIVPVRNNVDFDKEFRQPLYKSMSSSRDWIGCLFVIPVLPFFLLWSWISGWLKKRNR